MGARPGSCVDVMVALSGQTRAPANFPVESERGDTVPCVCCGDEKQQEKKKKEMSVSNGTLLFEIFRIRKQKRKREEKGKRKKKKHVWLFVSWYISSIPSPIYIHS